MKKSILIIGICLLSNLLFGQQIKKVEVIGEELNVVGRVAYGSYLVNNFTKDEINKYNIRNTIGYLVEYIYENKVIHRDIFGISNMVLSSEVQYNLYPRSFPCFESSSISNEVSFSLMKTNEWEVKPSAKGESVCYKQGWLGNGLGFIKSDDLKKFQIIDLADGKIKLKLHRLEE